jgi:6-phosphogluconolactonase (cycloisomerase 2 family)
VAILIASGGGCGNGLFPRVTSSGTATATPVTNAFLYATNFTDGTVSAFTRNTNTGALSFIAKHSAGAARGPMGIAVTTQNDAVYLANAADGNVYGYTIDSTGDLTSLPSIAAGTTPQMVAIDATGSFVFVTNAGSQSVSQYTISSSGALLANGAVTGFAGKPFGVTTHPSLQLVYVSDNTAGFIYSFSIGSTGLLTQIGTAIPSNGASRGNPGLMAIAIDASQGYLFVDDTVLGVVSVFLIQSNGSLAYSGSFGTSQSKPIGIGAVNNLNNYVYTANMTGNFVQPYQRTNAALSQLSAVTTNSGPTGLAIDPAGLFLYTGNSGNGSIALFGINNTAACGSQPLCLIKTFASESPANSNAGTQFVATTN